MATKKYRYDFKDATMYMVMNIYGEKLFNVLMKYRRRFNESGNEYLSLIFNPPKLVDKSNLVFYCYKVGSDYINEARIDGRYKGRGANMIPEYLVNKNIYEWTDTDFRDVYLSVTECINTHYRRVARSV